MQERKGLRTIILLISILLMCSLFMGCSQIVVTGKDSAPSDVATMYITVAAKKDNVAYCFVGKDDYSFENTTFCTMPVEDTSGNKIECEVGDLFVFESDGLIKETYPSQLSKPYSATKMAYADEEQMKLIEEQVQMLKYFND